MFRQIRALLLPKDTIKTATTQMQTDKLLFVSLENDNKTKNRFALCGLSLLLGRNIVEE